MFFIIYVCYLICFLKIIALTRRIRQDANCWLPKDFSWAGNKKRVNISSKYETNSYVMRTGPSTVNREPLA